MAIGSFTQQLSEARRRASLSGRPLTSQETAGIAEGQADAASARLARSKALKLEEESGLRNERLSNQQMALQRELQEKALAASAEQAGAARELQAEALAAQQRMWDAEFQYTKDWNERMAEQAQDQLAADMKRAQTTGAIGGGMAGAYLGYTIGAGTAIGGPYGAAIGAVVGIIGGWLGGKGCVIVTCCCGRDSEEVKVTRRFRDKFLNDTQLIGYYALANRVVPFLEKHAWARKLTKRLLVDRLVDYGRVMLGEQGKTRLWGSEFVSEWFLWLIEAVGQAGIDRVMVRSVSEVHQ